MADHNPATDIKAEWRRRNPERAREQWRKDRRAAYLRDPDKFRAASRLTAGPNHLRSKYGVTVEDYARMLAEQGGVCAICQRPERVRARGSDRPRLLSVDHDHATGEVRGLLCHACNTAIGHLAEDPALFARAVEYLRGER